MSLFSFLSACGLSPCLCPRCLEAAGSEEAVSGIPGQPVSSCFARCQIVTTGGVPSPGLLNVCLLAMTQLTSLFFCSVFLCIMKLAADDSWIQSLQSLAGFVLAECEEGTLTGSQRLLLPASAKFRLQFVGSDAARYTFDKHTHSICTHTHTHTSQISFKKNTALCTIR